MSVALHNFERAMFWFLGIFSLAIDDRSYGLGMNDQQSLHMINPQHSYQFTGM